MTMISGKIKGITINGREFDCDTNKFKKFRPKNAYQDWYVRLGGCRHKGLLPRGKKFKNGISSIKNQAFYTANANSASAFRTRKVKCKISFDEKMGCDYRKNFESNPLDTLNL